MLKKIIKVVGAIIENDNSEILCALRSKDMSLSGFWEFPGGKIENGESPEKTITKEIYEKLGCKVEFSSLFSATTYEYDNYILNLIVAKCKLTHNNPLAKEHAKLLWLPIDYIESLNWAPADIPTVKKLILKHKKDCITNSPNKIYN